MHWKYHCPPLYWGELREQSQVVWLRPEDPNFRGDLGNLVHLTVRTLSLMQEFLNLNEQERELLARFETNHESQWWAWPFRRLEDRRVMIVRVADFDLDELLEWGRTYLCGLGHEVLILTEMTFEESLDIDKLIYSCTS